MPQKQHNADIPNADREKVVTLRSHPKSYSSPIGRSWRP